MDIDKEIERLEKELKEWKEGKRHPIKWGSVSDITDYNYEVEKCEIKLKYLKLWKSDREKIIKIIINYKGRLEHELVSNDYLIVEFDKVLKEIEELK